MNGHAIRQQGSTLIEILITLLILLFGLLGLVGVSSRAHMAELESFQRIQALELLQDIANRLNANRKVAACYSNANTGVTLNTNTVDSSIPACTLGTPQQQNQAFADMKAWRDLIKGTTEANSASGAPIGAVGCITQDSPNVYLIAVAWQGLARTAAPTLSDGTVFPCGKGTFGDNALHRVVTTKVQIGDLS
ncbi:type IV pilus modification protein PilV [Acidovorax soli]|uniref:type IV pilus modification protein PilV n=1 Tax=Acidovorax soli TaxID=592050 RepID=UPI0032B2F754